MCLSTKSFIFPFCSHFNWPSFHICQDATPLVLAPPLPAPALNVTLIDFNEQQLLQPPRAVSSSPPPSPPICCSLCLAMWETPTGPCVCTTLKAGQR